MYTTSRRTALAALLGGAMATAARSMKVTRIDVTEVIVPMKKGAVTSDNYGATRDVSLAEFDKYSKFLLRLHTDDGLVGLGETGRQVPAEAVHRNAQWLKGKAIQDLDLSLPQLGLPGNRTADAFEIALYDLLGKALGLPVCALLGGCHQKKVAVSYWTGQRTIEDLVKIGERGVELGFKNLKFKARNGDPIDRQLAAVARAAPSLSFIVDFNSSIPDVPSFLHLAKRLEGYPVTIEDPVPKRLEWFAQIRRRTNIPIALTPGGATQMYEAIRQEAADVFNLGGNMREFVRLGHLAEVAGIPAWHGSGVELGIRDVSFIHAAAATRSCTVPSDTLCFLREHDLLATPFRVTSGFFEVPKGPGLGVEFDEHAVRRYRVGAVKTI